MPNKLIIPLDKFVDYIHREFPASKGHIPLRDSVEVIQKQMEALRKVAEAVKIECKPFRFPDEDRPEIWEAYQNAKKLIPDL